MIVPPAKERQDSHGRHGQGPWVLVVAEQRSSDEISMLHQRKGREGQGSSRIGRIPGWWTASSTATGPQRVYRSDSISGEWQVVEAEEALAEAPAPVGPTNIICAVIDELPRRGKPFTPCHDRPWIVDHGSWSDKRKPQGELRTGLHRGSLHSNGLVVLFSGSMTPPFCRCKY